MTLPDGAMRLELLLGRTQNRGAARCVGLQRRGDNDDLVRNGFSPFTGQLEPGVRRSGRAFFIKISYLVRKSNG
jgi:hypothetical protein